MTTARTSTLRGLSGVPTLDRKLAGWRQLGADAARPAGGWIKAIREALAMAPAELAERMGLERSTVVRLEKSEQLGKIQLDTLTRAADALGCEVVYALVPRQSLEDTVIERAEQVARAELAAIDHTMLLEDQLSKSDDDDRRVREFAQQLLNQPGLWHDRS